MVVMGQITKRLRVPSWPLRYNYEDISGKKMNDFYNIKYFSRYIGFILVFQLDKNSIGILKWTYSFLSQSVKRPLY